MTTDERDKDPRYLEALRKSYEHHEDGAHRTEESYQDFHMESYDCALCQYLVSIGVGCSLCPLSDGGGCARVFYKARDAKERKDFPAFHAAEVALADRIKRELDRVLAKQEAPKSAHRDGDRCELPVHPLDVRELKGRVLLYSGEYRNPLRGEWANIGGTASIAEFDFHTPREILRLVIDKKPKTTVTVWRKCPDAKINITKLHNIYVEPNEKWYRGQYSFHSIPDIARVVRETLDEGALVVKVECTETLPQKYTTCLQAYALVMWNTLLGRWHPCTNYDGEKRVYHRWGIDGCSEQAYDIPISTIDDAVAKYLAAQKPQDKPAFKAGDIVYWERAGKIMEITSIDGNTFSMVDASGTTMWRGCAAFSELRPPTFDELKAYKDEKYTFTLPGGVKVRAYDDGTYTPIAVCVQDVRHWYTRESGEALCAALVSEDGRKGLPIKKLAPGEQPEYPKGDGK